VPTERAPERPLVRGSQRLLAPPESPT
jgi:hypothetical protein